MITHKHSELKFPTPPPKHDVSSISTIYNVTTTTRDLLSLCEHEFMDHTNIHLYTNVHLYTCKQTYTCTQTYTWTQTYTCTPVHKCTPANYSKSPHHSVLSLITLILSWYLPLLTLSKVLTSFETLLQVITKINNNKSSPRLTTTSHHHD